MAYLQYLIMIERARLAVKLADVPLQLVILIETLHFLRAAPRLVPNVLQPVHRALVLG